MRLYRCLYMLPKLTTPFPASRQPRQLERLLRIDPFRRNSSVSNSLGGHDPVSHESAMSMVKKMTDEERDALRQALTKYETTKLVGQQLEEECVEPPSRADLKQLMIVNSVPFIGFGFLDNFFMIIAGDYIESTLGVYMCISTLAAAGLGNTISDVMGLGLAHYVEQFCVFMGMRPPQLTPEQIDGKACRRVMSYGRAIGITIGCIIGMFPLYFMHKKPTPKATETE